MFERFAGKKEGTLWYYRALVKEFRKAGSNPLVEELDRVVTALESLAAVAVALASGGSPCALLSQARNALQFFLAHRLPMSPSNKLSHRLFTIGHSNQEMSELLGVLIRHEIHMVCDVRSRPGSFRFPQFNREPLMAQLATAKIIYQFFGDQFGGRPIDTRYYRPDGLVDYAARRKAPDFLEAMDRLLGAYRTRMWS